MLQAHGGILLVWLSTYGAAASLTCAGLAGLVLYAKRRLTHARHDGAGALLLRSAVLATLMNPALLILADLTSVLEAGGGASLWGALILPIALFFGIATWLRSRQRVSLPEDGTMSPEWIARRPTKR